MIINPARTAHEADRTEKRCKNRDTNRQPRHRATRQEIVLGTPLSPDKGGTHRDHENQVDGEHRMIQWGETLHDSILALASARIAKLGIGSDGPVDPS